MTPDPLAPPPPISSISSPSAKPKAKAGRVRRALGAFVRAVETTRRVIANLIFVLLVTILAVVLFSDGVPHLHPHSVLVLALDGPIVEQSSGTVGERLREELQGQYTHEVQLRDVLKVLNAAITDPKIERVLLMLDDFDGAGLATLREVAAALERVRAAGKQVIAWGTSYDQRQYFLAAHADEVYLDPMGAVEIRGFGGLRSYFKDAFDRLGVKVNVFRAGKFKNAAETFSDNGPSPETQTADAELYDALWNIWTTDVEHARQLSEGSINAALEEAPQRLAAAGGDAARMALDAKWVDKLLTEDELKDLLVERGELGEDGESFRQISFDAYLSRQRPELTGKVVGVVVAQGEISDGVEGPGRIGGRSTAELIRSARQDDAVEAIVLRVDSPGGSVMGSELIRRELELTREAGKPVVVSMGDVAASGGYWISMAADEVIADAATITGSIGVIALLPTAEETMNKLAVHSEGYATHWLAQAYDPRKNMDPRFAAMVQAGIGHTYAQFLGHVAEARNSTTENIDAVAQGRVWSGEQALERGLIDRVGGYTDALQSAATRAGLDGGHYRVKYIEREFSPYARLLELLGASSALSSTSLQASLIKILGGTPMNALPAAATQELGRNMSWVMNSANEVARGRKAYVGTVHCFCAAP